MTVCPEEVAAWRFPDLAAEFADTLGRLWVMSREGLLPTMPPEWEPIVVGLESFVSVAHDAEVVWSPPAVSA